MTGRPGAAGTAAGIVDAHHHLWRGVVGGVTLTDPGLAGTLDAARPGPGGQWLVGCRHQVQSEPDPDYLARPAVHRGLSIVAAAGLVFDLVVRVDQLFAAARAARAVPEQGGSEQG